MTHFKLMSFIFYGMETSLGHTVCNSMSILNPNCIEVAEVAALTAQ